jgi:hypothetical protein
MTRIKKASSVISILCCHQSGAAEPVEDAIDELLPRGVRINVVSPGPFDTPLSDKLGTPDA